MSPRGSQPLPCVASAQFRWVLAGLTLAIVGCGETVPENERAVFPASGVISFRGQPIPDASVVLHPVVSPNDGKPFYMPRATVGKDGTFQFSTYRHGDGAPPGEYQVSVSWQGPLDGVDDDEEDDLRERLPRKYTNPKTSGIAVTIVEGPNELEEMALN